MFHIHSSLNRSIRLLALTALVLSLNWAFAASNEPPFKVSEPCTPNERWAFGPEVREQIPEAIRDVFKKRGKNSDVLENVKNFSSKHPLISTFLEYRLGRALLEAKFEDLAQSKFLSIVNAVEGPFSPIQTAAARCVVEIQRKFPFLPINKDLEKKVYRVASFPEPTETSIREFLIEQTGGATPEEIKGFLALIKREPGLEGAFIPLFTGKKNELLLLRARLSYEAKKFEDVPKTALAIAKSSNVMPAALTTLSWSYLMRGQYAQAVGAVASLEIDQFKGLFTPESLYIIAVSYNELCHYPEAVKMLNKWKRTYHKTFTWLKNNKSNLYSVLLAEVKKPSNTVPPQVFLEWLRSPIFQKYQEGINYYAKRKKALPEIEAQQTSLTSDVRSLFAKHSKLISDRQSAFTQKIEEELQATNKRLLEDLDFISENLDLLDAEILNGATQDMVWQSANPEFIKMVKDGTLPVSRDPDSSSSKTYDWGKSSSYFGETTEVWEDEIGALQAKLYNNCDNKEKYIQLKTTAVSNE